LCVSYVSVLAPVTDRWPVQGVHRLSPDNILDRISPPPPKPCNPEQDEAGIENGWINGAREIKHVSVIAEVTKVSQWRQRIHLWDRVTVLLEGKLWDDIFENADSGTFYSLADGTLNIISMYCNKSKEAKSLGMSMHRFRIPITQWEWTFIVLSG